MATPRFSTASISTSRVSLREQPRAEVRGGGVWAYDVAIGGMHRSRAMCAPEVVELTSHAGAHSSTEVATQKSMPLTLSTTCVGTHGTHGGRVVSVQLARVQCAASLNNGT